MANCPICSGKLGLLKLKTCDGAICGPCAEISSAYKTESIENLKQYWNANKERLSKFHATQTLKSLLSETIIIDDDHQFFIIGKVEKNAHDPIVYAFSELESYEFQQVGGKTVTKKKGGIGRALVGGAIAGPVGAIVGASTSKEETVTKGGTSVLYVDLKLASGKKRIIMTNPPIGFTPFLDRCMAIEPVNANGSHPVSGADEILKYKALMDQGIINQEEFDAQKRKILSL